MTNTVICVVGPTASGKSELAQQLAKRSNGEVVSADSMQIYKGMDIGTGKLLPSERIVPHWGLDLIDIGQPYSAALFQTYARNCFLDISSRHKTPYLCGGTGFYVRAAIDDYQFPEGDQTSNPIRKKWNTYALTYGSEALWGKLNEHDAASAALIAKADTKRLVRAFELLASGTTYATQKENLQHIAQAIPATFIGLAIDADVLRARIDARIDHMLEIGLVKEVQNLLSNGFREGLTAPQAIGYKEIVSYLDGQITLDEAVEQIKVATHRYAKRQRTWFRKDERIQWIDANSTSIDDLIDQAGRILNKQ